MKNGPCTPTDQQFCYKTCGPEKTGVKTEMCTTAGTYAEMSGCSFEPSRDFSCYKIPAAANTACPAGVTPQGSMACDVPHCTLCNSLGGIVGGSYLDSGGAPKTGWCTCQEPNGGRPAHLDLRERHGLAVPAGRRLLSGRTDRVAENRADE